MVQSAPETGVCSHTGHEEGKVAWPRKDVRFFMFGPRVYGESLQDSQMAVSQHGNRKALTANLLQIAHRSLVGNSSCVREL
jgi:hypothetical protein